MNTWNIKVPKNYNKQNLAAWASECVNQGVPREVISLTLLSQSSLSLSLDQLEAKSEVEHTIFQVMLDRNLRGFQLEKEGNINEAIELYESNIMDWFSGNHPYDRLRVIYTKNGQINEAIRVCKSFVKVVDELISMGYQRGDLYPKRSKFVEHMKKLQTKLPPEG